MSWKKLVTGTMGMAAIFVIGLTLATPSSGLAQVQYNCGENSGNMCRKKCNATCGTTTACCDESYWYYPKAVE
jgi:hypothetical protein